MVIDGSSIKIIKAPYVKLKSTNIKALEKIDLDSLKEFADIS